MLAPQKLKEYAATDRTAIIHRGLRLSYRELDECSDTIAAFLLRQFGDDRSPVVICGNQGAGLSVLRPGRAQKRPGLCAHRALDAPPNAPAASCRLSSPR